MRILHFFPANDSMITQHVNMLAGRMGLEADNHLANSGESAKILLQQGLYDILHLHGCWQNDMRSLVQLAEKKKVRLVVSPHGQLEPWVRNENRWKEKLPKELFYQRDVIHRAYAVIIQGRMEQECLDHLAWNPRCVIIRNAIITQSITPIDMARQTFTLYQKIIDSNPLELMTDETRQMLFYIIKAGITGDVRWLEEEGRTPSYPTLDRSQWRLLFCLAHQEHITEIIQKGIRTLRLDTPDIDASQIPYFLPADYQDTQSITEVIGNQFVSENDRLLDTFRLLRKWQSNGQLSLRHLIELDRELRQYGCEEEDLAEQLKDHKLYTLACRLMQHMNQLTGLTEGFMPVPALDDRTTRKWQQQIEQHLKI